MFEKIGNVDVFIVAYNPDENQFIEVIEGLISQDNHAFESVNLHIYDNSVSELKSAFLETISSQFENQFSSISLTISEKNLGFGCGNNRLMSESNAQWVFLLNQDAIPEPSMFEALSNQIKKDSDQAVAWECRQIPFEHPKKYDPVSLETEWNSGAAVLYRRTALEEVQGFDENFFMYSEDVDLSWRLRAMGGVLRYVPKSAVFHDTYSEVGVEKPLQAIEGTLNNLKMRAKYGSWEDIKAGVFGALNEARRPSSYPGRGKQFALLPLRLLKHFSKSRQSGEKYRNKFKPTFSHWDYSVHRDGAYFDFKRHKEWGDVPLVSIIVRTHKRPDFLRETLLSIINQTYSNIEIIVVEDGAPTAESMIEEEFSQYPFVHYQATNEKVGRSAAGNLGLELARGEWLGFLDDDDQFFCDHIEVLIQTALAENVKGVYGLSWEVVTDVISQSPIRYNEISHSTAFRQEFCRPLMWRENYLPIQTVLFHRDIYEVHGGFETDMDQLEDWNLWTRYTLEDDFLMVPKTTSKYRVPASRDVSEHRQKQLDDAYSTAVTKQLKLSMAMSPPDVCKLIEEYNSVRPTTNFMTKPDLHKRLLRKIKTFV